ncbi:uncharacterized protein C10orf67 homolog, mitochondrial isoform X1 [Ornithorhynchus anatinus]|uniref:DUF4709 domain-containing protein n=1 Tax=Ornithorhynchus anatinus TaxID=9258 RepID=A0A6I8P1V5_ORNAN|nr:uncharacterized protein C10orf67 homolog, mitochondrial isoform X1 [Ornithorhynchus anatinus]
MASWGPAPRAERWREVLGDIEFSIEQLKLTSRISISDEIEVGFFNTDHSTQTDISEVMELKEMTRTTQTMLKITNSLQHDFTFLKSFLQTEFEKKLQEESWKLFTQLNDRLKVIEVHHRQKESQMRKSFCQQLSDAIAIIRASYKKYFEVDEEAAGTDVLSVKINVLMKKLEEKDALIRSLKEEILIYQENECPKVDLSSVSSIDQVALEKEIAEMRKENEKLSDIISDLEETIRLNEKENTFLESEIISMKELREKDQKTIEMLTTGREKLKLELDQERVLVEQMIQKQMEDMEETRKLTEVRKKSEEKQERERKLTHEKRGMKLSRKFPERRFTESHEEQKALQDELEKLNKKLEKEKKYTERLRNQADLSSKIWQKKFFILRNSLHALKDEMFLRHTLQRQFAVIPETSFSYSRDLPLYITPCSTQADIPTGNLSCPSVLPDTDAQDPMEEEETDGIPSEGENVPACSDGSLPGPGPEEMDGTEGSGLAPPAPSPDPRPGPGPEGAKDRPKGPAEGGGREEEPPAGPPTPP